MAGFLRPAPGSEAAGSLDGSRNCGALASQMIVGFRTLPTFGCRPGWRIGRITTCSAHDDPAHSWAQAAVELTNARRLSNDDARRVCSDNAHALMT